jgi:D-glycero-alpha-D-manno-heptose-7-phosphate kinase
MIISMTPLRISFLGGGTDYPEYADLYGGETLVTSIDKYTYITVSPLTEFFDHRIRVSYSKTELCRDVEAIQHPSVRECLKFLGIDGGIEISVVSDLPARTGLGSSSCFTVGLLHALHAFKGNLASKEQLAEEAVHIEREMIKERVGLQDQYSCACGGLSLLEFQVNNKVTVTPIPLTELRIKALEERLMLFYTGLQRTAHDILKEQIEKTTSGEAQPNLDTLKSLVREGVRVLSGGSDLSLFGHLLHDGWTLKKSLSSAISNGFIDDAYEAARSCGAIGGKLLGAGGGGFLLLYAEPYNQDNIRKKLSRLREVRFGFESFGSRILYYKPQ